MTINERPQAQVSKYKHTLTKGNQKEKQNVLTECRGMGEWKNNNIVLEVFCDFRRTSEWVHIMKLSRVCLALAQNTLQSNYCYL